MTTATTPSTLEGLDLELDFNPAIPCEAPHCGSEALWYGFRCCCDAAADEGKPIVAVCDKCRRKVLGLLSLGFVTLLLFGKCPHCGKWITKDSVKFVAIKEGRGADS